MKTTQFLFLCISMLVSLSAYSQEFEVPKNITLQSESDYKNYEKDVIDGISWMENTPINEQLSKRKETSAFLMKWMTGSPTVSIDLMPYVIELTDKNPDLLMSFLGGWTKYSLENQVGKEDKLGPSTAGLQSIFKVYASNKDNGIKKDNDVEKLTKMDSEKLEDWVSEKL